MNLQPSELMKVGLILFLAKYYHRISIENINSFRHLILPITVLIAPIILVATQPDLGTSILIASGGVVVAWLGLFWPRDEPDGAVSTLYRTLGVCTSLDFPTRFT